MPASWSPRLKRAVLTAVGVALFGVFVAVVGVAPVLYVLTAVVLLLILSLWWVWVPSEPDHPSVALNRRHQPLSGGGGAPPPTLTAWRRGR
jgi:hypothetical protein